MNLDEYVLHDVLARFTASHQQSGQPYELEMVLAEQFSKVDGVPPDSGGRTFD
jgi:hypothetical protein